MRGAIARIKIHGWEGSTRNTRSGKPVTLTSRQQGLEAKTAILSYVRSGVANVPRPVSGVRTEVSPPGLSAQKPELVRGRNAGRAPG